MKSIWICKTLLKIMQLHKPRFSNKMKGVNCILGRLVFKWTDIREKGIKFEPNLYTKNKKTRDAIKEVWKHLAYTSAKCYSIKELRKP